MLSNDNSVGDVVFVSDLHVGAGLDAATKRHDRFEAFFVDEAFADFVQYVQTPAKENGRPLNLVLLGDTLDFLHVRLGDSFPRIAHTPQSAAAVLTRIAAGHRAAFDALGTFVTAGFTLDVLPGNHDIELLDPTIQQLFRELVLAARYSTEAAQRIRFFPWIYYIPGLVYAEHGQQYHDINAFPSLLESERPLNEIPRPLGSYFDRYLCNLLERLDPAEALSQPSVEAVLRAARRQPLRVVSSVDLHARFVIMALRLAVQGLLPSRTDQRLAGRAYARYAAELGLSDRAVAAIGARAALSSLGMARRLVGLTARSLLRAVRRSSPQPDYMLGAAQAIQQILQGEGVAVPYFVFGHTHAATCQPLSPDTTAPVYFNTGTWTSTHPAELSRFRQAAPLLTYVHLSRSSATGRLMCWCNGSAEELSSPSPATGAGR